MCVVFIDITQLNNFFLFLSEVYFEKSLGLYCLTIPPSSLQNFKIIKYKNNILSMKIHFQFFFFIIKIIHKTWVYTLNDK